MPRIRRIFRMVGMEGATLNTVRRTLEREGVRNASGRKGWSRQYLRTRIEDDVYLSHTFEEISALVSPEVAGSLDPARSYGVWWYGRQRHVTTQSRTTAPDGTPRYGKTRKSVPTTREEWIAVPVSDAGVPKEWVLAAREAIRENEWSSNAGYRTWELSGGVLRCASCGRTMSVNYIAAKDRGYYCCTGRYNGGVENRCSASRTVRAEKAEVEVWEFVRRVLTDSARLAAGLENMQENEARSLDGASTEEEEASWLNRISEIGRKEERLLDLRLEGDITAEQFRAKSATLQEAREAATAGLEAARARRARREDFERDKEALIEYHTRLVPDDLDNLTSEQRSDLYRMMRLRLQARDGALVIAEWGCNALTTLPDSGHTRGR